MRLCCGAGLIKPTAWCAAIHDDRTEDRSIASQGKEADQRVPGTHRPDPCKGRQIQPCSTRILIFEQIAERQYTLEVFELTSKLLTKNPEYYTIWNVRRRLLIHGLFYKPSGSSSPSTESPSTSQTATITASSGDSSSSTSNLPTALTETPLNPASQTPGKSGTTLDLINGDLDFIFPLMIQFPKCYWIWNYRQWLLEEGNKRLEPAVARELWNRELALVGKMLTRDNRNFHGWAYRRTVISELESPRLHGQSMVESEFAYTTKMIKASLSNFSAWHNRSKLIPRLLDERDASNAARRQFLDDGRSSQ